MGAKAFSGLSQKGVKVALKTASRVCVNIYGMSGGHHIFRLIFLTSSAVYFFWPLEVQWAAEG